MSTHPLVPGTGAVTVYLTTWCPYCRRLVAGLSDIGVPFTGIDVDDDRAAAAFVERVNGGNRVVPTVVLPDGSTRTNPPAADVAAALR